VCAKKESVMNRSISSLFARLAVLATLASVAALATGCGEANQMTRHPASASDTRDSAPPRIDRMSAR
jgi:hypothetical protein